MPITETARVDDLARRAELTARNVGDICRQDGPLPAHLAAAALYAVPATELLDDDELLLAQTVVGKAVEAVEAALSELGELQERLGALRLAIAHEGTSEMPL